MRTVASFRLFALGSCVAVMLAGCSVPAHIATTATTSTSPSNPPTPPTPITPPTPPTPSSIPSTSVYVEDDNGPGFLIYPASATGATKPTLAIGGRAQPARKISLDAAGNIYLLSVNSTNNSAILEYAPVSPLGSPLRSLPVGTGTKIPSVRGLYASATGEIFVADGTGLSVFSATATGNADPVRRVTGTYLTNSGLDAIYAITVDRNDNAYVVNSSETPIVVYGPTANGTAAPIRKLGGNLTQFNGTIGGITTDAAGNLYVVCISQYGVGVREFGPTADGNVAPIRVIDGPLTGMYPYFFSLGVAVDSAANVYVSAGDLHASTQYTLPAVFKFSPVANGNAAPDSVVTLAGWYDSEEPQIAVR